MRIYASPDDARLTKDRSFVNNNGSEPLKQRYNYAEAAVYLGVSKRTVSRAKASGELQYCQIGRRVVFTRQALDDYIRRHSHGGAMRRSSRHHEHNQEVDQSTGPLVNPESESPAVRPQQDPIQ
jgi:excisionase family DNA binding protein